MTISPALPPNRLRGKRSNPDWSQGTVSLHRDTKRRLEQALHLVRALGEYEGIADQSECIDAAVREWLDRHSPEIRRRVVQGG